MVVDCLTDWPHTFPMGNDTTSADTINVVRGLFCHTASTDILWSDDGPQFTSDKFEAFLNNWGVHRVISSPHYPKSNGKAVHCQIDETAHQGCLEMPLSQPGHPISLPPAQEHALHERRHVTSTEALRTPDPRLSLHTKGPSPLNGSVQLTLSMPTVSAESFYDQHAHPLPDLAPGAHVAIQNPTSEVWDVYGTVTVVSPHRRYFIRTQSGRVLDRNCSLLRKRTAISVHAPAAPAPVPQELQQNIVTPPTPGQVIRH